MWQLIIEIKSYTLGHNEIQTLQQGRRLLSTSCYLNVNKLDKLATREVQCFTEDTFSPLHFAFWTRL